MTGSRYALGSTRTFALERLRESGLEETRRDAIVAVELHVIEGSGDAVPTRRGRGVGALHVRAGGEHDVTLPHRLADENDFELERRSDGERPGAEEVDARRADIAGNQCYGKILGYAVDAAQSQGELEGGARVNAVFRVNTNRVCGHAGEAAG